MNTTGQRPLIIAHRGGSPLDIDNSAAAFEHALRVGVDMLECDLRQTGDHRLVLLHDAAVTVEGRRLVVQDTVYAELNAALSWMMTFDEYLERFGPLLPFNLDLKTHGYEAEAARTLRRHSLDDQALISTGHTHSLWRLSRDEPRLRLALSRGHLNSSLPLSVVSGWLQVALHLLLPTLLRATGASATMLQYRVIDKRLVRRLHRKGFQVFAWTVDDEAQAIRLCRAGVDGIASNDPARIMAALNSE